MWLFSSQCHAGMSSPSILAYSHEEDEKYVKYSSSISSPANTKTIKWYLDEIYCWCGTAV